MRIALNYACSPVEPAGFIHQGMSAWTVEAFFRTINLSPSSCSLICPDNPMAHFYRSCLRLHQLCVGERNMVLKELSISPVDYSARPGQFRVRLQRALRAWGTGLEEWGAGLGLIASVRELLLRYPANLSLSQVKERSQHRRKRPTSG